MMNKIPNDVLLEIFKWLYALDPLIIDDKAAAILQMMGIYKSVIGNKYPICGAVLRSNSAYFRLRDLQSIKIGNNVHQQNMRGLDNYIKQFNIVVPQRTLNETFSIQQLQSNYCDLFDYIPRSVNWLMTGNCILRALYQQQLHGNNIILYVYGQHEHSEFVNFYNQLLDNLNTKFKILEVNITGGVKSMILDVGIKLHVIFTAAQTPHIILQDMPLDCQQLYIECNDNQYNIILSKHAVLSIQKNQATYRYNNHIIAYEAQQIKEILKCGIKIATINPIRAIGNCCIMIGNDICINTQYRNCNCLIDRYTSRSKYFYVPVKVAVKYNPVILEGIMLFDVSFSNSYIYSSTLHFIIPQKHKHFKQIEKLAIQCNNQVQHMTHPTDLQSIYFQQNKGFISLYAHSSSLSGLHEGTVYNVVLRPQKFIKSGAKYPTFYFDKQQTIAAS